MKKSLFLIALAICTYSAIAQTVQVDFTGTMTRYTFNSGNLSQTNLYQSGDTVQARLRYNTETFTLTEITQSGHWFRHWSSNNSISQFSVTVSRNSQILNEIDVLEDYTKQRLEVHSSSSGEPWEPLGSTEEGFSVNVSDLTNEPTVYTGIENFALFQLLTSQEIFTEPPFEPDRILNPDKYLFPENDVLVDMQFRIGSQYLNSGNRTGYEAYIFSIDTLEVLEIPEPATFALLWTGAFALLRSRR